MALLGWERGQKENIICYKFLRLRPLILLKKCYENKDVRMVKLVAPNNGRGTVIYLSFSKCKIKNIRTLNRKALVLMNVNWEG